MSRLDPLAGGFGGPRVVKPQDNVYTVLLVIACLFVVAALGLELVRMGKLKNPPSEAKPAQKTVMMIDTAPAAGHIQRLA